MEISLLKSLLNSITRLLQLSSCENIKSELVQNYCHNVEEILKVLKPIFEVIINTEIASDETLQKEFAGLHQSIDELREVLVNCQPLMSKVYFAIRVGPLSSKIQNHSLQILDLLKSYDQFLPSELSAASLEYCVQKIKPSGTHISSVIIKALKDQKQGSEVSSEILETIAGRLSLKSNQELLIEAVALEKLKENAEQAENNAEVECIDQMIGLVTHMHDLLVMRKQSQDNNHIPIPADFCCPLSLELMTDPVIVASGQTYERAFIRRWIDLGLTVCPKTRQTLVHTTLIPNYTVKALIAHWCESNNVKLPDPTKSTNFLNAESVGARKVNGAGDSDLALFSTTPVAATSSGAPQRSLSPSHNNNSSSQSSAGINGNILEIGSLYLRSTDERLNQSAEGNNESVGDDERRLSQGHIRTNSASSTHSNVSHGTAADGNEGTSNLDAVYLSDASGELASQEAQPPVTPSTPTRDASFPSRLDPRRGQAIWRRPSDRFSPRVISSPTVEMTPEHLLVESQVRKLVEDLTNGSVDEQRTATGEIRLLAKHNMDNRIIIANCGAIRLLVNLLRSSDLMIQENAVTALLNLSINDINKSAIANADAIEPLIYVLETGSPEAKENSAATLFSLSVFDENKTKIGRSGAIKPLVELLGTGSLRGKKDAATALFNLSISHDNKGRIVQAGAVKYLVELMDPAFGMVDKAVAVLSNLATIPEGRMAIGGQGGGIPSLVEVVELGSGRGKENAAAALLQLCMNSGRFCNMVLQEGAIPPLVALTQSGTPRAREKAQQLLSYFRNQRHGNGGR
ncbi:hypothetical protein M569_03979, partial [Genlisea aurea]